MRNDTRIYQLWDDLADMPAANIDHGLEHLMRVMCEWLRADNAVWVGAVRMARGQRAARDPLNGWRARARHVLLANPTLDRSAQQATRDLDSAPGMSTVALTRAAGEFRVHRLRDGFVDLAAFRRTAQFRRNYRDSGVSDRLFAVVPVNADAESYMLFDIYRSRRRFSERDAALAGEAMRGLKWFHRSLMLSHGLPLAARPLTPTQHRLLRLLLGGEMESVVAEKMGLTRATTHTYVTTLYRQFGVNSRAALAALWLSQTPSN